MLHQQSLESLKLKSELYEKLKNQESHELTKEKFLLDFGRKKTEDYINSSQYKKDKLEFYEKLRKSKLSETENFNKNAPEHIELSKRLHYMEKERQAWEKEVLEDIDNEFDELGNLRKRFFVKQSYDVSMTKKDIEALDEVLKTEKREKDRISLIKKKRLEAKRKRMEKLKKLKV